MNKLVELPIRVQLLLMVSLIALFALILTVYSGLQLRAEEITHAEQKAQSLALLVEVQQQSLVTSAEQMMYELSRMTEVASRNVPKVQAVLAETIILNPQYSTIFITNRNGDIWASALPTRGRTISDRDSFNKALSLGNFTAGQYMKGQYSGRQVLSFYYPYKNGKGEIIGVIILGIDLGYHKKLMTNIDWPDKTSYILLDHKGVILGMGLDKFIGERFKENEINQMKKGPVAATSMGIAHDGTKRIMAYRKMTLKGESEPYMYIRVGIPLGLVMANANRTLFRNLVSIITLLLFVFYMAWIIGKRSISDRVSILKTHSERLSKGGVMSRVSDLIKGGELGELALTIDHMADGITTREAALQQSEHRYRTLFEQSPDGIVIVDRSFRIVQFNDVACRQLSYTREEFSLLSIFDLDPDESLAEIEERTQKILEAGGAAFDVRHKTKLGEIRHHHVITQPVVLSGETVLYAIWQDVTERKRSEEALKESEAKFIELFINAADAIFIADMDTGVVVEANQAACRLMLLPHDEIVGLHYTRLHPPRTDEYSIETFEGFKNEAGQGMPAHPIENTVVRSDGVQVPVEILAALVIIGGKKCLMGTFRDITERKKNEEKIQQSEAFIRSILDTVDEGFIVIDRNFRILTANKAYCSQVGELCDAVIGQHCYEISHKTLRPCYEEGEECAVRHVFETGEPHTALHKHPDAKGSILYVETKAFPIKDSTGTVTSVIETVNNITEKHLLEEEQLKTQKLEAIGTLAGGIAHDFNNLLQGVFGYISMAKIMHDQRQKSLDMLEQAEKALHMSVNLTSQLLTFSKGGKPVTKKIAPRPVIENSVKFALSGSRVDYRLQVEEGLSMVEADEGQIGQVIQNLVLNAEQAMPMGGTINITAKNVSSRQKGLPTVLQQGNYVEISIKDTGIGIPEQYRQKIFDPYFTTKDKGSGLGLATSYSIIKNHAGFIDVKSKLGEGTTFSVYLPAAEGVEMSAVTVSEGDRALRKGRILLMDDEDIIRNIAGIMLRSLGHEVEMAENGEEAIEKYRDAIISGRRFDVVVMDLTVRGGMGGEEAIKELIQIDSDIRAIVSSGYTESSAIAEYKTIGFKACLTKPYDIDSLNATLNGLLD